MLKKTWNSPHFLRRAASHSTKGARNGRVDVLPTDASDPLYEIARQIADGKQRIADLRAEKDELTAESHSLGRVDQMRNRLETRHIGQNPKIAQLQRRVESVEAEIRRTQHRIGELNALLGGRQEVTFEGVFVQLAKAQLSEDTWRRLSDQARGIVSRAKEIGR